MYPRRFIPNSWIAPLALCVGLALLCADLRATIVAIEYYDQGVVNPEFAGGPLWTGHVDTNADTLTIETWKELPLHGGEFWIPRNIETNPLVWPARKADGTLFDVPDTFDGNIDNTFAFISDLHLREMLWEAPVFDYSPLPENPPVLLGTVDVEFTLNVTDVWPGWGGLAQLRNVNGVIVKVFETANPSQLPNQPVYDEHIMPALPVGPNAYTWSTDATITAVPMPLEPNPVPEARQWLAILAAFSGVVALRWLGEHRRAARVRCET